MRLQRSVAIAFLSLLSACTLASDTENSQGIGRFALDSGSLQQWTLPKKLKEISGLALTPDDRLFAVADEKANIYELDYQRGEIIKKFALGSPSIRDDFEGIAYLNELIYIVTSSGRIFEFAEGNDGDRVQFKAYPTALGSYCEVEGLAQDAKTDTLLVSCKRNRASGKRADLSIFVWSPTTGEFIREREITVPQRAIAEKIGKKRLSPSAVAIDPETGDLYGVAGPQQAIFQLKPNGEPIDAIILPLANRHRQPEGIEITRDGKLLIADEGGKKKARLSVYAPGHNKTTDQQE